MKKANLIRLLASLGIIAVDTSCENSDQYYETNTATPNNEAFTSTTADIDFKPFTPISEIRLNKQISHKIMAIAKLSHDVFLDSEVAKEFSQDPKRYLRSIGLGDVDLDIDCVEVKAVLALGDQEIKDALVRNDYNEYINLLESKNYLNYNTIKCDKELANYLSQQIDDNPQLKALMKQEADLSPGIQAVAIFPFYAVAVAVSQAAVAYNVAAAVNAGVAINVGAWVNVAAWVNVSTPSSASSSASSGVSTSGTMEISAGGGCSTSNCHMAAAAKSAEYGSFANRLTHESFTNNPVLKIWGYETNKSDLYVVNPLIERQVEEITNMVENLDIYKRTKHKLKTEELKNLLRKPVTQKMIDFGLI